MFTFLHGRSSSVYNIFKFRMDSNKSLCRLCAKETEDYFEIFSEKGIAWKIASIVSTHFWIELKESDEHLHICHTCWWTIESFHVYYLQIQESQKRFESVIDECEVKIESLDFEYTNGDVERNGGSTFIGNENGPGGTKEEHCDESQDETPVDYQFGTDDHPQEKEMIDLYSTTDTVCKVGYAVGFSDTAPSANKNRRQPKRDDPSVLADDNLIRYWCQMQCTECPKLFYELTFKDVRIHYRKEHGMDGFLTCCRRKFYRRFRALEHIATHINPKEFSCEKCNKNFSEKASLIIHLEMHASPERRAYKCNDCDETFVRRFQLSQHQNKRHFPKEKKFACHKCSKSFGTKYVLLSHFRNMHMQGSSSVLMCDICAKTFKSKRSLQDHLIQHKGEDTTRVQCTICSAWLKHQKSLRSHMARHIEAESEHICKECGKKSPNRNALVSHQKNVHSNAKLFPCALCDKSFKKALTLKEHVASCHTGEVLYHCPFCTKTFNSSANFYSHKKRMHQTDQTTRSGKVKSAT